MCLHEDLKDLLFRRSSLEGCLSCVSHCSVVQPVRLCCGFWRACRYGQPFGIVTWHFYLESVYLRTKQCQYGKGEEGIAKKIFKVKIF